MATKKASKKAAPKAAQKPAAKPAARAATRQQAADDQELDQWGNVIDRSVVTFTKLRDGTWGVRGYELENGAAYDVTQKNGETREVTIARVIWADDTGLALATVVKEERAQENGARAGARSSAGAQRKGRQPGDDDLPF